MTQSVQHRSMPLQVARDINFNKLCRGNNYAVLSSEFTIYDFADHIDDPYLRDFIYEAAEQEYILSTTKDFGEAMRVKRKQTDIEQRCLNYYTYIMRDSDSDNDYLEVPAELNSDKAQKIWKAAIAKGWFDESLQPLKLTSSQSVLFAHMMAEELKLKSYWGAFETLWNRQYLAQEYNRVSKRKDADGIYKVLYTFFDTIGA